MDGKLPILPGETPKVSDFTDHLSTAFPEVRLKSFLEMRGADGGPWNRICALPAFWVGLLYDQTALDAAWDEVKDWPIDERQRLRDEVPKLGLATRTPDGGTLRDLARRILAIAEAGLVARGRLNAAGDSESGFLDPLREIVARGTTPAEQLLERYHGAWGGDVSRVYDEMSF
jgi:glutamate--cysteine ligase